jgi:hypothetical protein
MSPEGGTIFSINRIIGIVLVLVLIYLTLQTFGLLPW